MIDLIVPSLDCFVRQYDTIILSVAKSLVALCLILMNNEACLLLPNTKHYSCQTTVTQLFFVFSSLPLEIAG